MEEKGRRKKQREGHIEKLQGHYCSGNTLRLNLLFKPLGIIHPSLKIQPFSLLKRTVSKSPLRVKRLKKPLTFRPSGLPLWYSAKCCPMGLSSLRLMLLTCSPTLARSQHLVLNTQSFLQGHSNRQRTLVVAQLINCLMLYLLAPESVNISDRSTNLQIPQWPHGNIRFNSDRSVNQFLLVVLANSDWTNVSFRLPARLAARYGLDPTMSFRSLERVNICQCSLSILLTSFH